MPNVDQSTGIFGMRRYLCLASAGVFLGWCSACFVPDYNPCTENGIRRYLLSVPRQTSASFLILAKSPRSISTMSGPRYPAIPPEKLTSEQKVFHDAMAEKIKNGMGST